MTTAREIIARAKGLHDRIAADVHQISRGLVWCTSCGRVQAVNGAGCLHSGWPKCCGYTMTIDSPDERRALAEEKRP